MTKFAYPIYSRDWHGISLVDLARERGMSPRRVASRDFYRALYEKWRAADFTPDPGWLRAKRKMAAVVKADVERHAPPPAAVISLGAGLGVVERELIQAGWPVDLQECQAESLAYARRFLHTKLWTVDFDQLPSGAYDVVLALSLVYVFDGTAYRAFAAECRRMLKPGGLLLVWDHDPKVPLSLAKRYVDRYVLGRRDLKWGWLRSPALHAAIVESRGFEPVDRAYYDANIDRVPDPPRVWGLQWPRGRSVALSLIFRRT